MFESFIDKNGINYNLSLTDRLNSDNTLNQSSDLFMI